MTRPFSDPRLRDLLSTAFGPQVEVEWPDYTQFTPWLPLDRRMYPVRNGSQPTADIGDFHGVYLVALFDSIDAVPGGRASPFDPYLVYVGRTRKQTLGDRWGNLAHSAKTGRGNHSGGKSFHGREVAGAGLDVQSVLGRTRVAGLPVWLGSGAESEQPATSFRTGLLEALLVDGVHHHRLANGLPPLLNKP